MSGPLAGFRIVEVVGLGPGPFAAMLLADMGADVIRVDRPSKPGRRVPEARFDVLARGRRSIVIDLEGPIGREILLRLVARADALLEGFRPGVMERLLLGPDACQAVNPKLVYGRMTGWGQDGPYATTAGHDINYIALAGVLHQIGRAGQRPVPPLNLVGDFGGGGLLLAFGLLCGILEAQRSGRGQVVDAAMVDGAALLMASLWGLRPTGAYNGERGTNMLDGGAHFYDVYETADGLFVSLGAIERRFYAELCRLTGFEAAERDPADQHDRATWPGRQKEMAELIRTRTRDEWCRLLEGTDACFAPVLSMDEAPGHAHNQARSTFVDCDGVTQPAPAPRFSRTPGAIRRPPARPGEHTNEVLAEWLDLSDTELEGLRASGTFG